MSALALGVRGFDGAGFDSVPTVYADYEILESHLISFGSGTPPIRFLG
jgi:hypothetical protein